jgi:hypothetical protein
VLDVDNARSNAVSEEVAAEELARRNGKDKDYEIVINGSLAVVHDEVVTYEQVVALGFPHGQPGIKYSVAYRKATGGHGGSGTLAPGASVTVKRKGTSFDVTPTTRS